MEALTDGAEAGAGARAAPAPSCSWASWGPGSRARRGRWPPSSASSPLDSDRELERELGEPIESFFDREGEAAFRAREEEVVLALLARPDAEVVALGGGSLGSERVREALAGPHGGAPRGRPRGRLAAGLRQGPAAGARPRPLRPAPRGPRRAVRRQPPTS